MIRLKRSRSQRDIHPNFYGQKKRTLEIELLLNQRRILRGKIQKHTFNSNRWKPAKKQLLVETGGKCAYCEARISVVAFGDVEHYRPKSSYWWLAYCYDNYIASCQLCNQRFKKDAFPIQNQRMSQPIIPIILSDISDEFIAFIIDIAPDPLNQTQVNAFIRLHEQERPLLLNPYFDDPLEYFAWRVDDVLREVEITDNPENPQIEIVVNAVNLEVEPIAAASIAYYGLNRQELKDHRYTIYKCYSTFRQTLEDDRISPETRYSNRNAIEAMKAPGEEFAGMIRYFDGFPS